MGLVLTETQASLAVRETAQSRFSWQAGPGGTAAQASSFTQTSVTLDFSRSVTSLDADTAGAIFGSVREAAAGRGAQAQSDLLAQTLDDLGDTLAKGQGAYFVSFQTPGGGLVASSLTPAQFADILSGKTSNQFGPTLSQTLRDSVAKASKKERSAEAALNGQPPATGREADAETALYLFSADRTGRITSEAKFDVDPGGQHRLRVLEDSVPAPDGEGPIKLTVAYIPPSDTSTTEVNLGVASRTAATLDITA